MTTKTTSDRWAVCKAMSALTGVSSAVFFQHFAKIDEAIGNAAMTQASDSHDSAETNALREHINALNASSPTELPVPPAQPLPDELQQQQATSIPDQDVAKYVERLRIALWYIVQCGGVDQAKFVLDQAAKSFPDDTSPAFKKP